MHGLVSLHQLEKRYARCGQLLYKLKKGQRRVQKSLKFALCGKSRTYLQIDQRSEISYGGVGVKL